MLTDEEIGTIKAAWENLFKGPRPASRIIFDNLKYVEADEPTIVE